MKKILLFMCILCTMSSCGSDDPVIDDPINPEQPTEPDKPDIKTKQIKSMTVYYPSDNHFIKQTLTYDKKKRISQIKTEISGGQEDDMITNFIYGENQIISETKIICRHSNPSYYNCDNAGNLYSYTQEMSLNEQGFVSKVGYIEKGITEGYETSPDFYLFQYADNYLKRFEESSTRYIKYTYSNDNLTTFLKYGKDHGVEREDVTYISYSKYKNKLGISPMLLTEDYRSIWIGVNEDYYTFGSFFGYYSGFYGKHSKHLEENIDNGSLIFEYEFDKDGYPVKIISKDFDENGQYDKDSDDSFLVDIVYQE